MNREHAEGRVSLKVQKEAVRQEVNTIMANWKRPDRLVTITTRITSSSEDNPTDGNGTGVIEKISCSCGDTERKQSVCRHGYAVCKFINAPAAEVVGCISSFWKSDTSSIAQGILLSKLKARMDAANFR